MPPFERDVLVGDAVELEHRDARARASPRRAAASRGRARRRAPCPRSPAADLRMIMRAPAPARAPLRSRARRRRSCARRGSDELAGRAVVLDERRGLLVVVASRRSIASGVSSARPSTRRASAAGRELLPSGSWSSEDDVERRPISSSSVVERLGLHDRCAGSRRARSRRVSPRSSRSRISRIVISSATRSPRSRIGSTLPAELGPRRSSSRGTCRRSRCAGRRTSSAIFFACVPFPAPLRSEDRGCSAEEPFVVAHHHLRLHLAHRVERDADDDQHRGAAERAARRLREAEVLDEEARRDRDGREEERARAASVAAARGRGTPRSAAPDGCPGCSRRSCAGCRPGRPG